jgi:hypothetical protein
LRRYQARRVHAESSQRAQHPARRGHLQPRRGGRLVQVPIAGIVSVKEWQRQYKH